MRNTSRRSRTVAAALSLGGLAAAAYLGPGVAQAADWPMLRGNTQRSGVSEEVVKPPLALLWQFTGPAQRNNPNAPAIVGDTVYFAAGGTLSGGGVVYALDARTGGQRWRYPRDGGAAGVTFQTAPLVEGGAVYIGASDGNLYMLDAKTGEMTRTFKTGGAISSSPAFAGGTLYFGSNDDTLYAMNPATGQSAWRDEYRAGDNINSAPLIADQLVFVSSSDQFIHAVNAATGIGKWQFRLPFSIMTNGLVWAENTLYVPAGARLHAFQPRSGSLRWQQQLPADIAVPPVAANGVVYVIDNDRKLYALRSSNGREAWAAPVQLPYAASSAPTISGDVIYVPTIRNTLYALSREDGKTLWDYEIKPAVNAPNLPAPATAAISAPIAIANGTLYTLTEDGSISAFRPDAPDSTPPLADSLFPRPGSYLTGRPPLTFAARLVDPGSGLNKDSIKLTVSDPQGNSQELDPTFDASRDLVFYRSAEQGRGVNLTLPNGRHTVTLTARDWLGNPVEETWSFTVDNQLPPTVDREQTPPAPPRTATVRGSTAGTGRLAPSTIGRRPGQQGGFGNQRGGQQGGRQGGFGNQRGGQQGGQRGNRGNRGNRGGGF